MSIPSCFKPDVLEDEEDTTDKTLNIPVVPPNTQARQKALVMNMKPASQEHILKKPSSKKAKESKLAKAVKKTLLKKPSSKESKTDQIWKKVYVSQSHVNDIRAEITGVEKTARLVKRYILLHFTSIIGEKLTWKTQFGLKKKLLPRT